MYFVSKSICSSDLAGGTPTVLDFFLLLLFSLEAIAEVGCTFNLLTGDDSFHSRVFKCQFRLLS